MEAIIPYFVSLLVAGYTYPSPSLHSLRQAATLLLLVFPKCFACVPVLPWFPHLGVPILPWFSNFGVPAFGWFRNCGVPAFGLFPYFGVPAFGWFANFGVPGLPWFPNFGFPIFIMPPAFFFLQCTPQRLLRKQEAGLF